MRESLSASNAARCSHEVRVIPCRFANSLTLASSSASNLRLTRTFFAKLSSPALACCLRLGVEACFFPHVVGFGASGRRTETLVAPAVIRDDLALTTTPIGHPVPSREKDSAIAAASERFIFGPGGRLHSKSRDPGGNKSSGPPSRHAWSDVASSHFGTDGERIYEIVTVRRGEENHHGNAIR
jgi:hypothetical protein